MLQPKKTKHRKTFRLYHDKRDAHSGNFVAFGDYGLQATGSAWVSAAQIEAARIAITRRMGREGQVIIRVFPHLALTSKPIGVRMGSGKGSVDRWVAVVKRNTILFEVRGVKDEIARDALRLGGHKLPLKWKIVATV
ncbi:50S ribosomal protein L16 [Mesomycoplasma hyopneumoniae]|uniref:Large ribosomal subunit protein uL16 n=4 Tax=Mesomycoplasma hyopneumoniae TaxID=2099 RepID=RL16_MESH2|nr:50S ribosomal protein L16 [Mesomycoplasma hyopneumoniae]Q4A8H8.1 RecName: Full=Large ribosomal subunit protein uL16; AltName: Full=50S ribosomal protein L16 [Mesomycoplasma hyopneumoniae 7448]Q4AAE7.1 RecName: Full=Large ribosomal subunit protein uL16; AltName: Full=50S ribosomal protein L16 [Mesomycoplasma hyopneumoniae J]Q601K7.1 RecName: Full=Large ribosomal subunit protein uL16; AltName: Full=50S ribosomal protein L16 [Mesomycoplasma hyopneumoniae 232]AAV27451.1 50s ribosomal protein L16